MIQLTEADLASPAFKANPYPTFAWLRTHDPVHQFTSPDGQSVWLVTRHQDAEFVLRDEHFTKDRRKVCPPEVDTPIPGSLADLIDTGMLRLDPPEHMRLRSLVSFSFTPRLVEEWRGRIQEITNELIDAVEGKGSMDLVEEFAFPLPIRVISEMLGVPKEDGPKLHRWTKLIADVLGDPAAFEQAAEHLRALHEYLMALIESKRRVPVNDLASKLVQAEVEGDRLSTRELRSMIFLLIIAGHETTGNMISTGMLALLTHPDQMALLKQQPTLIKTAIEEFLRYQSPLTLATLRWAREDIEFHGKQIHRGEEVAISLSAANRDAKEFEDPERLDITRQKNPHLAFAASKGRLLSALCCVVSPIYACRSPWRTCAGVRAQRCWGWISYQWYSRNPTEKNWKNNLRRTRANNAGQPL